jgi:hypothetical protein
MRRSLLVGSLLAGLVAAPPARAHQELSPITFAHYQVPETFRFAHRAGETSIGVNPETNSAFFQARLDTVKTRWDDAPYPQPAWTSLDAPFGATNDPILWVDPMTGRVFVVHLEAGTLSSRLSYSDDDGRTWSPATVAHALPGWDHQTIGGGRYKILPQGLNPVYPNILYFCAQFGADLCTRSDTGGLTWSNPFLMSVGFCNGPHGHVTVAPDGTAYVPHGACGSTQAVVVSETDGAAWVTRRVPGTRPLPHFSDPKVAFDKAGRMYFAGQNGPLLAVATSDDRGLTWTTPVDLGAAFGVQNTEFPLVIAGDQGRAAVAFYGTTTPGNDQLANFDGAWHLYVAYTFDGGRSWKTDDLTPDDPVQRGCIWLGGGSNPCRNLLDFQDMTVDREGRVLISYADGCTELKGCNSAFGTPDTSRDSRGTIARQTSGPRLFAEFDPAGPEPLAVTAGGPYRFNGVDPVTLRASAVAGVPPYSFAWDLDGDGAFDDATGAKASFVPADGARPAVRATDATGATAAADAALLVPEPASQTEAERWTFTDGSVCVGEGWTADADQPSPASWHVVGPPCAWYHGIDALQMYTWTQGIDLTSPCVSLPAGTASASVRFGLSGRTADQNLLTVQTVGCEGGAPTKITTFSGPQSGEVSVDLTRVLDQGPFRVRFHLQVGDLTLGVPPWPEGYHVGPVSIWSQ